MQRNSKMVDIVIVQTSLGPNSKTAILAKKAQELLETKGVSVEFIDLREKEMMFCDGRDIKDYSQDMQDIAKTLTEAKGAIIAYPVYNYSFSGVAKNFVDIFSYYLDSKFVGLLHNSGGIRSANEGISEMIKSLALHNNITTVQPVIHTFAGDFNENGEFTQDMTKEMLEKLCENISSKL